MEPRESLRRVKSVGTGLSFIVFPLVWVFAFAAHPDLLRPRLFLAPEELIWRARGNAWLQFGHALVAANTALLVVLTLRFMKVLEHTRAARAGFVGAALAIFGACMLAADKGALCLTMSALDNLSKQEFDAMLPGLIAIFSFKGWMAMVWGLVLMPVGVLVQTVGMMKARVLSRQQGALLSVSLVLIGFPDGAEIINLLAAMLMAAAMLPYGVRLITGVERQQRAPAR